MRTSIWSIMGSGLLTVGLVACTEELSMPDRTEGAAFFADNCVSCHGVRGHGDGPLAAGLPTTPSNLATLSRRNGGTFPDARALSYIYGDPMQAHLARVMPQFGGAMAEDLVPVEFDGIMTPTPRVLAGLLAYLESIQE
ncbi:c-type cytochrome [Sulfitobacter sp.]|uniref:c-type cytochrome n=1 Tax=Sulfitobacter sp. TaxID=1903071 RepID=UPI0030021940